MSRDFHMLSFITEIHDLEVLECVYARVAAHHAVIGFNGARGLILARIIHSGDSCLSRFTVCGQHGSVRAGFCVFPVVIHIADCDRLPVWAGKAGCFMFTGN